MPERIRLVEGHVNELLIVNHLTNCSVYNDRRYHIELANRPTN